MRLREFGQVCVYQGSTIHKQMLKQRGTEGGYFRQSFLHSLVEVLFSGNKQYKQNSLLVYQQNINNTVKWNMVWTSI